MERSKIDRINELARKQKNGTLSPLEKEEQAALRRDYLHEFRNSFSAQLNSVYVELEDGTYERLQKKGAATEGGPADA